MSQALGNKSKQYFDYFQLQEFRDSTRLQFIAYFLLLSFAYIFSTWTEYEVTSRVESKSSTTLCWPHFQNCKWLHFLTVPPQGYSYYLLFIVLSLFVALACFCLYNKRYVLFHIFASLLIVWEFFFIFFWSMNQIANYYYYHFVLLFFLLFASPRLLSLRVVFVFLYFLAGQVKFHKGWVLATYFTTLKSGMLQVPDLVAPLMCWLVILLEVIGSWWLLSNNLRMRFFIVSLFVLFHLYSAQYVGFDYPFTVMPHLLLLFACRDKINLAEFSFRKCKVGICAMSLGLILHLIGDLIPGDEKWTLEGYSYGLYMFDANHQCRSHITINDVSGSSKSETQESIMSRQRCDPYSQLMKIKTICFSNPNVKSVKWTFDHSINGEPFFRMVDESNACSLDYKAFRHNKWIRSPNDGAQFIGYPVKNCINCL